MVMINEQYPEESRISTAEVPTCTNSSNYNEDTQVLMQAATIVKDEKNTVNKSYSCQMLIQSSKP